MKLRFPHPLTLLIGFIVLVAVLSWVLPAGQFERRDDPVTGRKVVVAGTYHSVPQQPVTPFQAVVAIPKGIADAASVIAFVFLVGGAFGVVDRTGALRRGVGWMVQRLKRRERGDSDLLHCVRGWRRAREHAGGDHTAGAGSPSPHDAARIRSAGCRSGERRRGGSWLGVQSDQSIPGWNSPEAGGAAAPVGIGNCLCHPRHLRRYIARYNFRPKDISPVLS
jgi:hypothetical protein